MMNLSSEREKFATEINFVVFHCRFRVKLPHPLPPPQRGGGKNGGAAHRRRPKAAAFGIRFLKIDLHAKFVGKSPK